MKKLTSIVAALIAVTSTSSTLCSATSPLQSLLRMNNLPGADSEAAPTAITREGEEASASFRPLPSLPTHTEVPHPPQSFTHDQLNTLRAQIHALKVANRGKPVRKPVRKHTREAIHAPNPHDLEPPLREPDANTSNVDSDVKTTNGFDPDTAVNGSVIGQRPAEVSASPQLVREEEVEVEVVYSKKISRGTNT